MYHKKIIAAFALTISIPLLHSMGDEATATLKVPNLNALVETINRSTQELTQSLDSFITACRPSSLGTLALVTGVFCSHSLFVRYPSKPAAQRSTSDWTIPTVGLTISTGTLLYLWSQTGK